MPEKGQTDHATPNHLQSVEIISVAYLRVGVQNSHLNVILYAFDISKKEYPITRKLACKPDLF